MRRNKGLLSVLMSLLLVLLCTALPACSVATDDAGAASTPSQEQPVTDANKDSATSTPGATSQDKSAPPEATVTEDGEYSSKDEVAAYIHEFGHLPANYISKTKATKAGWVSSEGNLWDVLPGKSIGGSKYWNDDGALPEADGRTWTECDINYQGGFRGAERIVFSNDGLVYYTPDHYQTWEQLY